MDSAVRHLYKKLIWIGRTYPAGISGYREQLKQAFKNSPLTKESIAKGEFVFKEMEALHKLHKYRYLNKQYRRED